MAGTSVKAAGRVENRFKYNGKELQHQEFGDGSGLEYYDYGARMYDDQIGRWIQEDPLSYKMMSISPYAYANNDPIKFIDHGGMEPIDSRFVFRGKTARSENLSQPAIKVLNSIINKLGVDRMTITSTGRTPSEQARIMFDNLENGRSSSYGRGGRSVIKVYAEMKKNNASDEEIKGAMEAKIYEVGPTNVSKHTSNPKQMNAVDFGINSLMNDIGSEKMEKLKDLLESLETKGVIKRFLNPGNNPGEAAYHIEILNTGGQGGENGQFQMIWKEIITPKSDHPEDSKDLKKSQDRFFENSLNESRKSRNSILTNSFE